MKKTELKRLLDAIGELSADECSAARKAIGEREGKVEGSVLVRKMTDSVSECPHCGCDELAKAGSKDGRRRFRCKACFKSFNALTGTPIACLRMVDKHVRNAKCMTEGLSLPKTANLLGINIKTAFRWRHRFLSLLQEMQPSRLSGLVEADETYFIESFKGQRTAIPRKSKKRGTKAKKRGLSEEQIPVLVARERAGGATLSIVLPSRSAADIGNELAPRMPKDSELISDEATAYRAFAKRSGVALRIVPKHPKHKTSESLHINNVNAYHSRLKNWMDRFKGVATKNLNAYLGWHRYLDANMRTTPRKFLAVAVGLQA